MKILTIIFSSKYAALLGDMASSKPKAVFQLLQHIVDRRAVEAIFEGRYHNVNHPGLFNFSAAPSTHLVLTVEMHPDIRANSESVWDCVRKFARAAKSSYSIRKLGNHQVIQFSENVKIPESK